MLQVNNISISYPGKQIVDSVSFDLYPKEIQVLIGANGAGKSTLFNAIAGGGIRYEGEVWWEGENLRSLDMQTLAQRRAVLSQQVQLAFPIQVKELVEMGFYVLPYSLTELERVRIVEKALEEVGMEAFLCREFGSLSGGEQKRVLLAKCLAQLFCAENLPGARYLLLDEPFAGLDVHQQHKLCQLLKRLVQEYELGIFAILHDLNLASIFADTLLFMKQGKIQYQGKPSEVMNTQTLTHILGIHSIIHKHPIYGCPQITPILS